MGMIGPYTQIRDIQPQNRVQSIQKLGSGDMQVTLHSGQTFTTSKDDPEIQAFIVYSVLYEL